MKKYLDGGRTISEKAAMRKVGKGKGTIAYEYGSDSAPGTEGNKGEYIGYSRKARKDSASGKTPGTSMKDAKTPRPVKKKNNEKMEELRNAQKSKPEMNYTNPYTPKGKKGMVVKTKYKTGGMSMKPGMMKRGGAKKK